MDLVNLMHVVVRVSHDWMAHVCVNKIQMISSCYRSTSPRAWQGEKVFWGAARKLYKAGVRSPLQLPMQHVGGVKRQRQTQGLPRMFRATEETDVLVQYTLQESK